MKKIKFIVVLLILIIYFNCVFVSKVYASSEDILNGRTFRKVEFVEDGNNMICNYHIFNKSGLQEGYFVLPKGFYDFSNFFITCDSNGVLRYYYTSNSSTTNWYIRTGGTDFSITPDGNSKNSFSYYEYDKETDSWGDRITPFEYLNLSSFSANDVIYSKNANIYLCDNFPSKGMNYSCDISLLRDFGEFLVPDLKYVVGTGFRIFLNDYNAFTTTTDVSTKFGQLKNLSVTVYDINSKQYMTENLDILQHCEILQDKDGNGYIDLPFSTYFQYMNTISADFLIVIASNFRSFTDAKAFSGASNSSAFVQTVDYPNLRLFRYKYWADTGSGLLIETDADGNPKDPSQSLDPPKTDPNQGVIDAVGGLGSSIDNQTQKIEEQTNAINDLNETNKNIFQKIIELPRSNYKWFFRNA